MKSHFKFLCAIVLFTAILITGCSRKNQIPNGGSAGGNNGGSIQIKGSDTMVNLGQAWAEAFMKKYPNANVSVTGGGSGTGIAALLNGTTEIAESSRSMEKKEIDDAKKNGVDPQEIVVGYDGIAVVVHPGNPVSVLTIDQLADIFTGKITDWSQAGGKKGKIVILSREVNSGTHVYFKEHVLNKGDSKGKEEYASTALMMPSSQAIADEVAQNKNAIGYYGMGYISKKQKVLGIKKDKNASPVKLAIDTVISGKYPISRPLFMYANGQPKGLVKTFIEFVLSSQGQDIVKKMDFVPLGTPNTAGKKG
jgi:phosphate transport system substrate-binding protein